MIKNALYYPYIYFQDINWLKAMALFYDRIYRIVPPQMEVDDREEIKPFHSDHKIFCEISPIPYSEEASRMFLEKMRNWKAASLHFAGEKHIDIHLSKISKDVGNLFKELGYKTSDYWVNLPERIASNYMLYLATVISEKNKLSLLTDKLAPWTATNYFIYDGQFDEFSLDINSVSESNNPLYFFTFVLHELIPANISDIPISSILEFRKRRQDEMAQLRNAISVVYNSLQEIQDRGVLTDRINDSISDVRKAVDEYKKSADLLKARGWKGSLLMGLPASVGLATLFGGSNPQLIILGAAGFAINAVYSFYNTKRELRELARKNPYSCLAMMGRDFGRYAGQRRGRSIDFHVIDYLKRFIGS
ncbi:MAG: DUF6236 family protein [Candidatus Eremiobacteraeota bacterium]|nr:DUF6236 family protein [Candidatus Eremiobacteraeota bacterium]